MPNDMPTLEPAVPSPTAARPGPRPTLAAATRTVAVPAPSATPDAAARHGEATGPVRFRRLRSPDDIPLIHHWFQQPHAAFWCLQGSTVGEVRALYETKLANPHEGVLLGLIDGEPVMLVEAYDPRHDELAEHYAVQDGDRGMHIFVAPARVRRPGFTRRMFRAVMDLMFDELGARRVVVEPDIHNEKIRVLNRAHGFIEQGVVRLRQQDKLAALALCTAHDYHRARRLPPVGQGEPAMTLAPRPVLHAHDAGRGTATTMPALAAHLTPEVWAKVSRLLACKALSEFAHEKLIQPVEDGTRRAARAHHQAFRLAALQGPALYRFEARRMALDHWAIDAASIEKTIDGEPQPVDAMALVLDFKPALGLKPELLPVYLDEIASTLYGAAYKHGKPGGSSRALLDADYQTLESSMMEGHPAFVANNGRLGFDGHDYRAYAPEAAAPFRIVWLAVHKQHAAFHSVPGLSHEQLLREELGEATLARFHGVLDALALKRDDYLIVPAHPWQWVNKLSVAFAPDVATRQIVCLGEGDDRYLAQQSIRTMFNCDVPTKRYVKTSLSILNMGFMRGLSPYYMSGTPGICQWIDDLIAQDAYLGSKGFTILREVASMGFRNRYYEAALEQDSPYKKMFSALWRESPLHRVRGGERLMTMAALLHVDADGEALLPLLIEASGLSTTAWLERYLAAYLDPLIHCFYAHDLVFMPHGENLIMVMQDHVPVRMIMKDIAEESALFTDEVELPETIRRLVMDFPDELKTLAIFIDIFDGFFRYMSRILVDAGCCTEDAFWGAVAVRVAGYQAAHPALQAKYARYDLFAPSFQQSCLNRLQMGNNQQMINLTDPSANLKIIGPLANPLAPFKPQRVRTVPDAVLAAG